MSRGWTSHIDVMPTLMEFCGVESSSPVQFDGVSLAPLLRGQASASERTLFVAHLGGSYANPTFELLPYDISAVLTTRWRLVFGKELYDITPRPHAENRCCRSSSAGCEEIEEGTRSLVFRCHPEDIRTLPNRAGRPG